MSHHLNDPHQPTGRRRGRRLPAAALAVLPAVLLAACGSSGTTTTTSTNAGAVTNSANAVPPTGRGSGRFSAVRECLQKQGITLPAPSGTPGQGPGGPPGGGFRAPEGVSQTKLREALKKCGLRNLGAGGRRSRLFDTAAGRAALTRYATCMRQNGVQLPAPNTTGKGPVFDTSGINTATAAFKAAEQRCRSDLPGAFLRRRAPGQPPPA